MARKKLTKEPRNDPPEEVVELADLRPHPRNYKRHPEEQLRHIVSSLEQYGVYRNVVISRDNTILAGHGVVEAAKLTGRSTIAVRRLDLDSDSPAALKVVTADNELGRFADSDDRALSELLKEIKDKDDLGLLGTGYDEKMLAALAMVTRPASELRDMNEAAEWVGMPEYDEGGIPIRLVVTFPSEVERKRFLDEKKLKVVKQVGSTWSARWPTVENEDLASVRFERPMDEAAEEETEELATDGALR